MFVITECSLTTEFVITEFHCIILVISSTFNRFQEADAFTFYLGRRCTWPGLECSWSWGQQQSRWFLLTGFPLALSGHLCFRLQHSQSLDPRRTHTSGRPRLAHPCQRSSGLRPCRERAPHLWYKWPCLKMKKSSLRYFPIFFNLSIANCEHKLFTSSWFSLHFWK